MDQTPSRSPTPLLAIGLVCLLALVAFFFWQNLPGAAPGPTPVPAGDPSAPGFEVRYNAVLTLARIGNPKIFEDPGRRAVYQEMLDEEQQLRNFRVKLDDGREVSDSAAARTTVINALDALAVLRRRQRALDLAALDPAIKKLAASGNPAVQQAVARLQSARSED